MGEQLQDVVVQGTCDSRFAEVREEFERNFTQRDELGASACLMLDGEVVVDLWGGTADPDSGRAWGRDTVNVIASCSKGVAAMCGNVLIDRGELDPDRPIAHYWPEFAQAGKDAIPVRQAFNHQSGLFTFGAPLPADRGCAEWELCVRVLEETAPFWEPGTRVGYHALTIGYLIGELVRRVDGRTIGRFLAEEIAGPHGLDLWFGIPADVEERVARSIPYDLTKLPPEQLAKMTDPSSPTAQVFGNTGGWVTDWDHPDLHAAELPAMGAITNARGLCGAYAAVIGGLVSEATLAGMRTTQSATDHDYVLQYRSTYTMGFSKSWVMPLPDGTTGGVCIGEDAFGTPGFGGQIGFADPGCGLAFAYTMNRHGEGTALNERGQSLIDAAYRALGSPGRAGGQWVRPPR